MVDLSQKTTQTQHKTKSTNKKTKNKNNKPTKQRNTQQHYQKTPVLSACSSAHCRSISVRAERLSVYVEQENCTIFVIEARCCASENEKNLLSLIDGQVSKPKEWEGALQKKNCSQLPGCLKVPGKRSFFFPRQLIEL